MDDLSWVIGDTRSELCVVIKHGTDGLDWARISEIFRRAPLEVRDPRGIQAAAENCYAVCTAWDGDRIVGFGRALCDGYFQAAIYDVVVMPEYQGKGVGRAIVEGLLECLPKTATVQICCVPGKEAFYRKLGFRTLKTGMALFPDEDAARASGYVI